MYCITVLLYDNRSMNVCVSGILQVGKLIIANKNDLLYTNLYKINNIIILIFLT